ncbi:MAG TPA: hypothetical protein DCY20_02390, partial [Firmicutes bacterium]|nr:hypothetical protein [Bacillota bacterium]
MSKKMDGILLKKLDPMRKLMPYLFKTRNGSIIYAPVEIDMEAAQIYLSQIKANPNLEQITIFELVVAALLRTYAKYPYLNRYISNKKIYGRQSFSISFVVLKNDQHKLKESIAKV